MDVCDDIREYSNLLEQQKRLLQNAKKRQGELPRDRQSKDALMFELTMALMARSSMGKRKDRSVIQSCFIPPAYLPCSTSIDELTPTKIGSLQLETHHRGTYLLLRAITPPNRMTGILVVVEDEQGDATMLQLYHQEAENIRPTTDVVDQGSVMLIKEPFFKVQASGGYGIRVDHLSDAVFLGINDDRVPSKWRPRLFEIQSAESDKLEGNGFVKEGKYWQAVKSYTNALALSNTHHETKIIKRNRSLAYLKTKHYDAALDDTGFPSFGTELSDKALFRAAEALYHLGRFEDSCTVLCRLCEHFPDNKQAAAALVRAKLRLAESSTGEYDFKLMQAEAKKYRPPHLDHATFIGPVEIQETKDKGRGLFLTQSVKAGDLLLCEKAFGHAYVDENDRGNASLSLLLDPEASRGFMGGQADLIGMLAQKLHSNPSTASAFTRLYRGTYKSVDVKFVDGQPVVDTFLVERIMSLNVFGSPISSLQLHKDVMANKAPTRSEHYSCGVWTMASYINHSCLSNVRRTFIGDMMVVRAAKDMKCGTELNFAYRIPGGIKSSKTDDDFMKSWGFACQCALCDDFRNTSARDIAERNVLEKRLESLCSCYTQGNDIPKKKMESLLKALNKTYRLPADEVPRLQIWEPQLLLARILFARGDRVKGLEAVSEALQYLGFAITGMDRDSLNFKVVKWGYMVDHVVEMLRHAQSAFETLGALEKSKQAEQCARVAYRILVGEDASFDRTYPKST